MRGPRWRPGHVLSLARNFFPEATPNSKNVRVSVQFRVRPQPGRSRVSASQPFELASHPQKQRRFRASEVSQGSAAALFGFIEQ